jgi:hypothetical protein
MLYATSGSRLFVADISTSEFQPGSSGLPDTGWVEVGELEALGLMGCSWDMDEFDAGEYINPLPEDREIVSYKKSRRKFPMDVILGLDPSDAGQLLLWKAYAVTDAFAFRMIFPDGVTKRTWWGLVTVISEVFDTANNVMRLQVSILPSGSVVR